MAENQSLLGRAWNAVKGAFKARPVAPPPDLGQQNSGLPYFQPPSYWGHYFARDTDYRHEVGDLDLNSLAMAVVNFTANRIPEARPVVARTSEAGDQELDFSHPAAELIRRPNAHHIWANYAAAISMGWWFNGNVYLYKSRGPTQEVLELWLLPHFLVEPRWPGDGRSPQVPDDPNNDPFLSHYQYTPPGKTPVLYSAKDIIHLKRGVDLMRPRLGLGAFESLYKELYGDERMALFTASIMKNMGIQVPILSPQDSDIKIDEVAAAAMKEQWMAKTTGARAGEPVINTIPITAEKFGFTPSEMDVAKLRLHPESRVCAVCQISPAALQVMVGIQNGTSYASSEQAREQGYEEVIIPIQTVWGEELTHQLLSEFKGSEGAELRFDTSKVRVLQEDADNLMKRAATGYLGGFLKRTDARKMVGLQTTPDDEVFFDPRGGSIVKEGEDPLNTTGTAAPPAKPPAKMLASFMDIERWFERLENEMKDFVAK